MARRRFEDDDEDEDDRPRRRTDAGGFPWTTALIVAGVLAALAIAVCGGLVYLGMKKVERVAEKAVEEMRAEMARQEAAAKAEAAEADAAHPPPAGPVRQPPASTFDQPADAGRWTVLFRSADPAAWDTDTDRPDSFAVSVWSAPKGVKYLRLRRMDTGDAIIIPLERGRLLLSGPATALVRWNGVGQQEEGAYHLGLADTETPAGPAATTAVVVDPGDLDDALASGFGSDPDADAGGQKYVWKGQALKRTAFEVAVTAGPLTPAEEGLVRR